MKAMIRTSSLNRRGPRVAPAKQEKDAPAPRRQVRFACPKGHTFDVTMIDDPEVQLPVQWPCRQHGLDSDLVETDVMTKPVDRKATPRTHLDRLYERRSIEELEALLQERLTWLRERETGAIAQVEKPTSGEDNGEARRHRAGEPAGLGPSKA